MLFLSGFLASPVKKYPSVFTGNISFLKNFFRSNFVSVTYLKTNFGD